MPKPTLLLEVEQALAAANEAKAELEAFDQAHPNLGADLASQTIRLDHISEALKWDPGSPVNIGVLVALSDAHGHQQDVVAPLRKLYEQGQELYLKSQWADRAYVHASHKWDGSAERLDYLMGLGLAALNKAPLTQE